MVIAIFGESCTGKSTLADGIKAELQAEVFSGKDYLRLSKGEAESAALFKRLLADAADGGANVIYVISEREQLDLLPPKCLRVLVTAELDTIKQRFAGRTGGKLPPPISAMLERKHGMFDNEPHDLHIQSGGSDTQEACKRIVQAARG